MTEEKSVEALGAELELQKAELRKLKDQLNPPPRPKSTYQPIDYTANASMPRSAMKTLIDALPSSFFSDLRADALKPNPITGGPNPQPQPQSQRKGGWVEPRPLEPPPGVALADRLMDHQDEIDRAELALKLAKAKLGKAE